jgi:hypothetical protein
VGNQNSVIREDFTSLVTDKKCDGDNTCIYIDIIRNKCMFVGMRIRG